MQSVAELEPVFAVLSPSLQGVHAVAPSVLEYVPRAQSTHWSPDAYVPAAHFTAGLTVKISNF